VIRENENEVYRHSSSQIPAHAARPQKRCCGTTSGPPWTRRMPAPWLSHHHRLL
jgi:hypothetical protein